MRRRACFAVVAGLLMLQAGCAGLGARWQAPEVSLAGARVQKLSFAEQRLALRLHVHNPNAVALPLDHIDFRLEIDGMAFAHAVSAQPVTVPAGGDGDLELEAFSDLSTLAALWRHLRALPDEVKAARRLPYRLDGWIEAGALGRLPFDRRGELDLNSPAFQLRAPGSS